MHPLPAAEPPFTISFSHAIAIAAMPLILPLRRRYASATFERQLM